MRAVVGGEATTGLMCTLTSEEGSNRVAWSSLGQMGKKTGAKLARDYKISRLPELLCLDPIDLFISAM
jgi:hypothetical protein